MADWSKNNVACANVWLALRSMGEIDVAFPECGVVTMRGLASWNDGDSPKMRKLKARALANQLHFFLRFVVKGRGESGITEIDAVQALTDGLIAGDDTLADFAAAVDTK